jgi:Potential Queuosine, Q, salvage protein family
VLDEIRAAAERIASTARFVHLERAAIPGYATGLPLAQARAPQLDPATHYSGEPDATLLFVVVLDAINFGSGYFPWLKKRPGLSGYFTVATSLKEHFEQRGVPSADALRKLKAEDCAHIFGQTLEGPAGELMRLFAEALNDLGNLVDSCYQGSFRRLVEASEGSAERLVEGLVEMQFYRDVPFYKRAQLTAADLATAGVVQFRDLDRLTIFADNLVPHVLRLDGVLVYDPGLVARIEREELIPSGSDEEVEIRACALQAVELLAAALRERGTPLTPMQLDYLLWNRGQGPLYKAVPRHRTRCVFY